MKLYWIDIIGIAFGSLFLAYGMEYNSIILLMIGAILWYIIGFFVGRKFEKRIKN